MCGIPRIRRPGREGFAGRFIQDIAAAAGVAAGHNWAAPTAGMPRRRTTTALRLRPHTVQLCIRCRHNPAGFWVSSSGSQAVRRPWCLSCWQQLDPGRCHRIPFDGQASAGRCR